ncbi:MAG: chromate resistance protein [Alphaproteobacteria bacterium]|nr:chromate resistance protein [Alphaproteobacteria bacterium]
MAPPAGTSNWLMLLHNIPPKPAYFRVKIWRRLQGLGAVAVKNAAYVLPRSEQALEDLGWTRRAIEEAGGEAVLCEARFVDGLDDRGLRALFDAARDADYAGIVEEIGRVELDADMAELESVARRLRRRFDQIAALDFFGAAGREPAEGALSGLEARMKRPQAKDRAAETDMARPRGRLWVTRASVFVDRIASAWLIKRFVDPRARFKFVSAPKYEPKPGELRYDMFDAEFTHEGDLCTFEVLVKRFAGDDRALGHLAEIVHDIDLKDGKYGRSEAGGVLQLIAGICGATDSDEERLKRGGELFETLYQSFRGRRA